MKLAYLLIPSDDPALADALTPIALQLGYSLQINVRKELAEREPPLAHFTYEALGIFRKAEQEARRLKHNYIGTGHILLGIIINTGTLAHKVLRNLDTDPQRVRSAVEPYHESWRSISNRKNRFNTTGTEGL